MSSDPSFEEQEALKHTVSSLEELRLKEQLQRSERELEELEHELHAIEGELEAQIEKGERYEVLARLCENFEELDKVGASYLFWGDLERPNNTAKHLESVRDKINERRWIIVFVNARLPEFVQTRTANDKRGVDFQTIRTKCRIFEKFTKRFQVTLKSHIR